MTKPVLFGAWKLEGYDTFSNEYYPLEGTYPTEIGARRAAQLRYEELERTQPTESSGGQAGILPYRSLGLA